MTNIYQNYVNALVGKNQEFEQLLLNGDIDNAIGRMTSRKDQANEAAKEYNVRTHKVMEREDKIITDRNGNRIRKESVWKLPIPYPMYINEIALVFLFGRPIKWMQLSDNTDNAFNAFNDVIKSTRFNAKIRECKRIAGAETESAMLFRVFKNREGKPDVQIRVIAHSKGDDIYTRWDNYGNLLSFAWGYYAKEGREDVVYHLDVYTDDNIYYCANRKDGWEVIDEKNIIGKIPVIVFQQQKEWEGVEPLIHREELIASRTADTNDYFADPIAIMSAELIKNMPDKKEGAKLLVAKGEHGVEGVAKYLTWDSAPQSKMQEIAWLQDQILSKTFTPNITIDTLKSLSSMSGKAIRMVMLLADIKASKNKERYDEYLDRTASLIISIIGNVLNVGLKAECDKLKVTHEYQEPFGDDIEGTLTNIIRSVDAGILTQESAIEQNPLVKDPTKEMARIKEATDEAMKQQMSLFAGGNEGGPQSSGNNDEV